MVFVLNYLPWAVLFGSLALAIWLQKKRNYTFLQSVGVFGAGFILYLLLQALTPSYMPKAAGVQRLANPAPQATNAEIEDRARRPELDTEQRQQRFDEKFDAVNQAREAIEK